MAYAYDAKVRHRHISHSLMLAHVQPSEVARAREKKLAFIKLSGGTEHVLAEAAAANSQFDGDTRILNAHILMPCVCTCAEHLPHTQTQTHHQALTELCAQCWSASCTLGTRIQKRALAHFSIDAIFLIEFRRRCTQRRTSVSVYEKKFGLLSEWATVLRMQAFGFECILAPGSPNQASDCLKSSLSCSASIA